LFIRFATFQVQIWKKKGRGKGNIKLCAREIEEMEKRGSVRETEKMFEVWDGIPLRLPRASIKALVHDQAFCISLYRNTSKMEKKENVFFAFNFFRILMFMFHGFLGMQRNWHVYMKLYLENPLNLYQCVFISVS